MEVDGQLESMLETTAQDTEAEVAIADAEEELKVATTIEAEVVAAEAEAATKVAAADAEMKADMASCMTRDGAGFYASQGWTGGEGVWSWRSEATKVEGALAV